jgi:hypothetical protein
MALGGEEANERADGEGINCDKDWSDRGSSNGIGDATSADEDSSMMEGRRE